MIASIKNFFHLLFTEGQEFFWIGVCMVSAIIVGIGILKYLFKLDNIKCDWLKNIILSLISVASCFVGTAIMFWSKGISFEFYWIVSGVVSAFTTLVYHSYAKWGIKNFVHWVGSKTLGRLFGIITSAKDVEELETQLKALPNDIKASIKKGKETIVDTELENL